MDYQGLESVEYLSSKYEGHFHCLQGGAPDGAPVVLLHGHMAHAIAFRRVWRRLGRQYRLYVPDLPGHGHDETFRGLQMQPSMEVLGEWLFDLLDTCIDGGAHLVGHSLGANIAYTAARLRPGRFCSLTLTSPGFMVMAPPGAATVLDYLPARLARLAMNRAGIRLLEPFRWKGAPMEPWEADAYVEPLRDVERLEFALRLGAVLVRGGKRLDGLEPVDVPTLLLFGDGDDFLDLKSADEIGQRLQARRVEIFERSGHSPPEDTPAEFVDAVVDFIDHSARCGKPS